MSRKRLKALHDEKRRIAAAFRSASSAAETEALKRKMSAVSAELKRLQSELKAAERSGAGAVAADRSNDPPPVPKHLALAAEDGEAPAGLQFEPLGDANCADWDAYVESCPRATLCHDSRWAAVVRDVMGQSPLSVLARLPDGRVVGVLPLYRLKSRLFGDYGVSVPYLNYGGALGDNTGIETGLMNEAVAGARRLGLDHLEFRDRAGRDGWPVRSDKASMIRRLPETGEALDTELGAKVRAQVQRAAREAGIAVERGCDEASLDAFYRVFARNMRDLGTPVYSRRLFEAILALWPDESWIVIVRLNGRPVGGAFLVRHRDTLEIPWASTLREFNPLGINMLMYREALGSAIDAGCGYFDFGRSSIDGGTYRFKRQWGAVPVQHHWHYWVRDGGAMPGLNPDNPRFRLLVRIWQHLPVAATRLIGPHIVRHLP